MRQWLENRRSRDTCQYSADIFFSILFLICSMLGLMLGKRERFKGLEWVFIGVVGLAFCL